jgi:hypothetical protein
MMPTNSRASIGFYDNVVSAFGSSRMIARENVHTYDIEAAYYPRRPFSNAFHEGMHVARNIAGACARGEPGL